MLAVDIAKNIREKEKGAALLERSIFLDFLKIGWCFVYDDR